jgi:hypothetical protein
VDLLYSPPEWLSAGFALFVLGCLALAGLGLYRSDWRLEDDVQEAMLANTAVAVGVMLATTGLTFYTRLPYVVDAAGGFGVGFLGAQLVIRAWRPWLRAPTPAERRERFVAAWYALGVLGVVPMLIAGAGAMPFVYRGGFLLLGAGFVLGGYNAYERGRLDADDGADSRTPAGE